jgi:hypothetical protein
MAEYKGIKGFKVQYLSADPSDPIIGQTWYNSTSKDLKYTGAAAGAWATGNKYSKNDLAGAGTQTAALAFGGYDVLHSIQMQQKNIMELLGQILLGLNTARYNLGGCGTQTAALAFGGYTPQLVLQEQQKNMMESTWTNLLEV